MQIKQDIDITEYTTFKIPAIAPFFCIITNQEDIIEVFKFIQKHKLSWFVLGGGSNIVIGDLTNTIVIKNEIRGMEHVGQTLLSVGAGEVWDTFVLYTVSHDIYCFAPLSFIPGTVGGAPVQNIGAYGQEVGNYISSVEAFDTDTQTFVTLSKDVCCFRYRDSIFKDNPNRFVITKVVFDVSFTSTIIPDYPGVFERLTNPQPSALDVRNAIISIRMSKLPDWNKEYNVGSFFKNSIVSNSQVSALQDTHKTISIFPVDAEHSKISAGWLIEHAGLKGFQKGNFKIYEKHALVIVHSGFGTYDELQEFKSIIISRVQEKFGILLEQEPITI